MVADIASILSYLNLSVSLLLVFSLLKKYIVEEGGGIGGEKHGENNDFF